MRFDPADEIEVALVIEGVLELLLLFTRACWRSLQADPLRFRHQAIEDRTQLVQPIVDVLQDAGHQPTTPRATTAWFMIWRTFCAWNQSLVFCSFASLPGA